MSFKDNFIKIDKSGRVVIPLEIRKNMGIADETLLSIEYSHSENRIIIEKAYGDCVQCGSSEGLFPFGGKNKKICEKCMKELITGFIEKISDGNDDRKDTYSKSDDE